MGTSKAMLPFGGETMLQRVVRLLADEVSWIVVVAANDQKLPALPPQVRVTHDRTPNLGPLEGIAVGLLALQPHDCDVYVTSCDVPRLKTSLVRYLFAQLKHHDIVVPQDEQHFHPLAAVYRSSILPLVESLLAQNMRRPAFLFQQVNTRAIQVDQLRFIDPELATLDNLNTPEDYQRALERENIAPPTPDSYPNQTT